MICGGFTTEYNVAEQIKMESGRLNFFFFFQCYLRSVGKTGGPTTVFQVNKAIELNTIKLVLKVFFLQINNKK